jgi:hypothetical protein
LRLNSRFFVERTFSRLERSAKNGRILRAAEKVSTSGLCNKGTASAGPIKTTELVGLQPLLIHLSPNSFFICGFVPRLRNLSSIFVVPRFPTFQFAKQCPVRAPEAQRLLARSSARGENASF